MDIQATKIDLVQKLLAITEESLLIKINSLLDKKMIVGYTTDGKPLTQDSYNKRLLKAENQIKKGQYISQEDLEEESENW